MRATILPSPIIRTNGQAKYCGLSTAYEVILILTTQLYSCLCNHNAIVFISFISRRKYCNMNTPNPQYSPFLTSGG